MSNATARKEAYEAHKLARTELYLTALREKAMSTVELSKQLKIPYSTVYREVNELVRTYQIHATGETRKKAPLFRCGSPNDAAPDLFFPSLKRPVGLVEFAKTQMGANWPVAKSALAANEFIHLILLYLELATKFTEGMSVTKDDVQALRNKFVENKNLIETQLRMIDQMILNDKRWTIDELRRIGNLPGHTHADLVPIIDSFNAKVKATTPTATEAS